TVHGIFLANFCELRTVNREQNNNNVTYLVLFIY
ncbi:MAG: hypothetical protein PWR27_2124, partial [Petroclostridium sp.]|nr:hypothetical protein [Petroclostridium sp.]